MVEMWVSHYGQAILASISHKRAVRVEKTSIICVLGSGKMVALRSRLSRLIGVDILRTTQPVYTVAMARVCIAAVAQWTAVALLHYIRGL